MNWSDYSFKRNKFSFKNYIKIKDREEKTQVVFETFQGIAANHCRLTINLELLSSSKLPCTNPKDK